MPGVCSPSSPGVGIAIGGSSVAEEGGDENPNLLLWTEAFDNAVWTKSSCSVLADQDGTADEVASLAAGAAIRQTTSTAATLGAAVTQVAAFGPAFVRRSVSNNFDGTAYIFSAEFKDTGVAAVPEVTLRLDRSGGFLRCSIEDPAGDGDYLVRNAQLEQAAAFTEYHARGGA